jgi:antirestriction protein ArdC
MEQNKIDIYQMVTDKIVAILEAGTIPWRKPWTGGGLPQNLITRKPYRGVNVFLLASLGYTQNFFLTFEQVKALGGSVRKGEKSQIVVFWKWIDTSKPDTTPPDEKKRQKPMLRYYNVFNVAQCDGIPSDRIPVVTRPNEPIEVCEGIVASMPNKPTFQHMENQAYYEPATDILNMPDIEYFVESEAYYATIFHELVHSTGHKDRLNRKELVESTKFGSYDYSSEELTAEIGSCYLQSYAGIVRNDMANSAAYIQGWLGKLKNDKRCIIYASGLAQKATDYILNSAAATEVEHEHEAHPQMAAV